MSNRNATAANRTPVNTVLHQLEAYMGDHKLRGHVYLTDHTVVVFATRRGLPGHWTETSARSRSGAPSR